MPDDAQPELCFCNQCLRRTRHQILASEARGENDDGFETSDEYQLIECKGCGNISYRTRHWNSDMVGIDGPYYRDEYYPPPVSRKVPEWLRELPLDIQSVLGEVYAALHAGSRYLATAGARTVLDLLFLDKIGDIGPFKQKIQKLEQDGHITNREAQLIDAVIEAGNASAHRGYAPSTKDLNHVMDILEAILDKLYIAEGKQEKLMAQAVAFKKRIPPRQP
jgi:Domain of unknown function (DUF4145)